MAEMTQPVNVERPRMARRASSLHWLHVVPGVLTLLMAGTAVLALVIFEAYYANSIYPGVQVWDVDLGGLTYSQAVARVEASFPYADQPVLTLRDGAQTWSVRPIEVGARLDTYAMVDAAYSLGRTGSLIERLQEQADLGRNGRRLSPIIVFDPAVARAYLDRLAASVNRPAQDAGLRLEGLQVITNPATVGRMLDTGPVVAEIQAAVHRLQPAEIPLSFRDVQPRLADVNIPAGELRALLGSPLELVELAPTGEAVRTWPVAPEVLAPMAHLRREGEQILVKLDEAQLRAVLEPIAPAVVLTATNGRYVFDEETKKFVVVSPSRDGRELDIPATLAQISRQAVTSNRRVPLVFRAIQPRYHDKMTPQELGITELISQGVTYYLGSSATRIKNIKTAASKFHGVIVAPGETFSFNQHLGNVSPEEGYEKALIIYEGRTVEGVGGGVCQVSTTAFRAAFQAGFPIVERWPHAYRVGWYERGFGPGLDATVFAPLVDFKFTNDTPYHLLIETYTLVDSSLVFKFYSTSDGRKVTIAKPEIANVVPHGPDIYEENPDLPPGTIKQVDWAVDGADVRVHRIVERDGKILYEDDIFTRYLPWQAVYQYGPGTPVPVSEPEP